MVLDETGENINTAEKLSLEASAINQAFTQQILLDGKRKQMPEPNPFYDEEESPGMQPASVAYRYRKFSFPGIELVREGGGEGGVRRVSGIVLTTAATGGVPTVVKTQLMRHGVMQGVRGRADKTRHVPMMSPSSSGRSAARLASPRSSQRLNAVEVTLDADRRRRRSSSSSASSSSSIWS